MKSDYLKAIRKMAVSLFGEVDENTYKNEDLENFLDYFFRVMSNIPEKRLTKAVDNFVLKGKTRNSWFFSDYAVIKFDKESKKILVEQPNLDVVSEIELSPRAVALDVYSLQKVAKGIIVVRSIAGQFEEYCSQYSLVREYRFKNQTPTFQEFYDKFAHQYICDEIGEEFVKKALAEREQKDIFNFLGQDDFGNVTIKLVNNENEQSIGIIHPEHKNFADRLRIPKMQHDIFSFQNGRYYHKTIGENHTKYGLKHFEETGENIFLSSTGTALLLIRVQNPEAYFKYTNNPELLAKAKDEIAKAKARIEHIEHERKLAEAGKVEKKKTTKRKPKISDLQPQEKQTPQAKKPATKTTKKKKTSQAETTKKENSLSDEKEND